jgi:hypothetical protein
MYTRVLKIMKTGGLSWDTRMKLKTAVQFHFETFRNLFLEFERTHTELMVAVDAVVRNDTQIYTVSQLRMEYYRKRSHYTVNECAVVNLLNTV